MYKFRSKQGFHRIMYVTLLCLHIQLNDSAPDLRDNVAVSKFSVFWSAPRFPILNALRGGFGTPEPEEWRQQVYARGCKAFDSNSALDDEEEHDPMEYEQSARLERKGAEGRNGDSSYEDFDKDPYGKEAASISRSFLSTAWDIRRQNGIPCWVYSLDLKLSIRTRPCTRAAHTLRLLAHRFGVLLRSWLSRGEHEWVHTKRLDPPPVGADSYQLPPEVSTPMIR